MKLKLTAAGLLLSAGAAFAQQPAGANDRYLSVIGLKVAAEHAQGLRDFYTKGPGSKTIPARQRQMPESVRWTLLESVYPGDPAHENDFMIAFVTQGAPPDPDPVKLDEFTRAAAGMSYADYMQKVRSMSSQNGQTLSHIHDVTPGYALAPGDHAVVRRLKFAEGKMNEMSELFRSIRLPITTERVKAGNYKGWTFSHLTFPTGGAVPYDATEVIVFKDKASAVGGLGQGNAAMAVFARLFPNKSYTAYMDSLRAGSKIVRTDLFKVVAAYSK